ncbi:hypothetical protein BDV37DRAFT_241370 [Aspergillus pseudonomiae]|uniref:Uncharacterized protein n=1 Tax=Aspergillus pseudonomiae TaxID=1506151 RepID=A0A5N7DP66_9EURO|nr:uncharacterized protein BDV37DRAFT_241370 [Aspergillus pseudonomiae]KAE8407268.1 hypothetical protein BDV37DRAFT_241370 [Aspergillus pseudonomiae]
MIISFGWSYYVKNVRSKFFSSNLIILFDGILCAVSVCACTVRIYSSSSCSNPIYTI